MAAGAPEQLQTCLLMLPAPPLQSMPGKSLYFLWRPGGYRIRPLLPVGERNIEVEECMGHLDGTTVRDMTSFKTNKGLLLLEKENLQAP